MPGVVAQPPQTLQETPFQSAALGFQDLRQKSQMSLQTVAEYIGGDEGRRIFGNPHLPIYRDSQVSTLAPRDDWRSYLAGRGRGVASAVVSPIAHLIASVYIFWMSDRSQTASGWPSPQ